MTIQIPRRNFLLGAGAMVALPFLESIASATQLGNAPKRLLYVYIPNGVHIPDWTPESTFTQTTKKKGEHHALPKLLPPSLAPLHKWKKEFSILTGLTCDTARANGDGPGDHARAAAAYLTGVQPYKANGAVSLGISADQIAAQTIGQETRLRSLQLGCEPSGIAGECDSGYACAYSNNISWQNESTPSGKEIHPRKLFDRLFRPGQDSSTTNAAQFKRRKSILDLINDDAKALRKNLNQQDREKLEEYFDGITELERRLDFIEKNGGMSVPDDARPSGNPTTFSQQARLLTDILALAFQTDTTRIATFMYGNEGSNRRYTELGIKGGHHTITHHKGEPNLIEDVKAINTMHIEEFTYLLERFAQTKVQGASLLDSTAIVFGSGIADGNKHDHHALPILLAGGSEMGLRHGKLRSYAKNTPLGNLHMELLHRLKIKSDMIGDANGRLGQIG